MLFYHRDITGNIIGIVDKNHNYMVKYAYNAWGKVSKTVNLGCEQALANNPFMFKGYFYDEESGFYYLKSRYYNPEICRFISMDNTSPKNLKDQMILTTAKSQPSLGDSSGIRLRDPRFPSWLGWEKYYFSSAGVLIHYVGNRFFPSWYPFSPWFDYKIKYHKQD